MYDLTILKRQLASIAVTLNEPKFLLPRSADQATAKLIDEELLRVQVELEDISKRRLPQLESSIRSAESRLTSIPRDHRWPAQDRVNQYSADLEDVRKKAAALAERALHLFIKNGELNAGQTAQDLQSLAEWGEKAFGHGTASLISRAFSGTVIYQAPTETVSISSVIPFVVFACVIIKRLREKIEKAGAN